MPVTGFFANAIRVLQSCFLFNIFILSNFYDFARLLGSGDKIARIRKSSDIREMEKILKEELSWE